MTNPPTEPDEAQHSAGTGDESDGSESSGPPGFIGDEQLPEDLQPTDDNPLAKPPDENAEEGRGPAPTQGPPSTG